MYASALDGYNFWRTTDSCDRALCRLIPPPHLVQHVGQARNHMHAAEIFASDTHRAIRPLAIAPHQPRLEAGSYGPAVIASVSTGSPPHIPQQWETHASSSSPTISTPSPISSPQVRHAASKIPRAGLPTSTSQLSVGAHDRSGVMCSADRVLRIRGSALDTTDVWTPSARRPRTAVNSCCPSPTNTSRASRGNRGIPLRSRIAPAASARACHPRARVQPSVTTS